MIFQSLALTDLNFAGHFSRATDIEKSKSLYIPCSLFVLFCLFWLYRHIFLLCLDNIISSNLVNCSNNVLF